MIEMINFLNRNRDHEFIELRLLSCYSAILPLLLNKETLDQYWEYGEQYIQLGTDWQQEKDKIWEVYCHIWTCYLNKNLNEKSLILARKFAIILEISKKIKNIIFLLWVYFMRYVKDSEILKWRIHLY